MHYGSTTEATDWESENWVVKLIHWLFFFIPRGSPDQEKLYPFVNKWLVEVDSDGKAIREIAIDNCGKPLFAAPNERNTGYWTDNPKIFIEDELNPINKEEFESLWSSF